MFLVFSVIEQDKDTSAVVKAMVQSVSQLRPKDRYLVASLSEKFLAFGIQYLPQWLTDGMILELEAQTSLSYLSYLEPFIII